MSTTMTAGLGAPVAARPRTRAGVAAAARARRERCFGPGVMRPMDGHEKRQVMRLALLMQRRTEARRHWGLLTAKHVDVLRALLWTFHNGRSGQCFPSLEAIAEAARCARSTAALAIAALEACGLLTWCQRIRRVAEVVVGRDGVPQKRPRVVRTSNAYRFAGAAEITAMIAEAAAAAGAAGRWAIARRSPVARPSPAAEAAMAAAADGPPASPHGSKSEGRTGTTDQGFQSKGTRGKVVVARHGEGPVGDVGPAVGKAGVRGGREGTPWSRAVAAVAPVFGSGGGATVPRGATGDGRPRERGAPAEPPGGIEAALSRLAARRGESLARRAAADGCRAVGEGAVAGG